MWLTILPAVSLQAGVQCCPHSHKCSELISPLLEVVWIPSKESSAWLWQALLLLLRSHKGLSHTAPFYPDFPQPTSHAWNFTEGWCPGSAHPTRNPGCPHWHPTQAFVIFNNSPSQQTASFLGTLGSSDPQGSPLGSAPGSGTQWLPAQRCTASGKKCASGSGLTQ